MLTDDSLPVIGIVISESASVGRSDSKLKKYPLRSSKVYLILNYIFETAVIFIIDKSVY